jgi:hypothetical protein
LSDYPQNSAWPATGKLAWTGLRCPVQWVAPAPAFLAEAHGQSANIAQAGNEKFAYVRNPACGCNSGFFFLRDAMHPSRLQKTRKRRNPVLHSHLCSVSYVIRVENMLHELAEGNPDPVIFYKVFKPSRLTVRLPGGCGRKPPAATLVEVLNAENCRKS